MERDFNANELRFQMRFASPSAGPKAQHCSGKVWDLERAVAVMGRSQLGETLSRKEIEAIAAFLGTLKGEQPRVEFPLLPTETAATPRPEPMQP